MRWPSSRRSASARARRLQVLTVTVAEGQAHPADKTAGAITGMSRADGYIDIPTDSGGLEAGTPVLVKLF